MFLRIWFAAFFRALLADFEATVNGYIKACAETEIQSISNIDCSLFLDSTASKLSGALWRRATESLLAR